MGAPAATPTAAPAGIDAPDPLVRPISAPHDGARASDAREDAGIRLASLPAPPARGRHRGRVYVAVVALLAAIAAGAFVLRRPASPEPTDTASSVKAGRASTTSSPTDPTRASTSSTAPTTRAPSTTQSPSRQQPTAGFGIGDDFSATCVIAWPSAPQRGSQSTTIRTTCSGVPSKFLFVDITVPDPNLPVTPSRSRVKVRGEIADISKNQMGFTVLVVLASSAEVL